MALSLASSSLAADLASEDEVRSCAQNMQRLSKVAEELQQDLAELNDSEKRNQAMKARLVSIAGNSNLTSDEKEQAWKLYSREDVKHKKNVASVKQRIDTMDKDTNQHLSKCTDLRFSRKTRDAVCSSGTYPEYCMAHTRVE